MFGPKHYVPIIKSKRAELGSIDHLGESARGRMTPLVEIVPSKKKEAIPRIKSIAKILAKILVDRRCFADLALMQKGITPAEGVAIFFAEAAKAGLLAVPVTSIGRSREYQAAVKKVLQRDRAGIVLRLSSDDAENENLDKLVQALLGLLEVSPTEVDLVLDYGHFSGSKGTLAAIERQGILSVPSLPDWRTFSVAAGTAPKDHSALPKGQWIKLPRIDWQAWLSVATSPQLRPPRVPSYSDYTTLHPEPTLDGFAAPPNLRYSDRTDLMIWRGDKNGPHGNRYEGIVDICKSLVQREEWLAFGKDFSWGDLEIWQTATNQGSLGNPETWKRWTINHYLELVASQVASLPGT